MRKNLPFKVQNKFDIYWNIDKILLSFYNSMELLVSAEQTHNSLGG